MSSIPNLIIGEVKEFEKYKNLLLTALIHCGLVVFIGVESTI
jgi:hypothetical protein